MAESTYQGSCHCGAVEYQVELDLDQPAITCNCSICGRSGSMLMFVPSAKFTLAKGEGALTDYQFNKHVIHHLFCSTCGVKSFALGKSAGGDMVAVNVRCLQGVEPEKLTTKAFDGRSL